MALNVLDGNQQLQAAGSPSRASRSRGALRPRSAYTYFNMEDPVVGGYATEKIALRRAIGMAYNTDEEIRVVWQGQAMPATQSCRRTCSASTQARRIHARFDPAAAKALLDQFGYVDRDKDGWRDLPDGKPLMLKISSAAVRLDRQLRRAVEEAA